MVSRLFRAFRELSLFEPPIDPNHPPELHAIAVSPHPDSMSSQVIEHSQGQVCTPAAKRRWHLITSEYPPQTGGVGDYTHLMAARLADQGDEVHVWCPSHPSPAPVSDGIAVHRELGAITPADLRRVSRELAQFPAPRRLVVQYVPHGYGYRSMNVGFCWWLWMRARVHGDRVELIVHEAYLLFRKGALKHSAASLVHRFMATVLLNAASRVWVTIPTWAQRLRPYALGRRLPFRWLPIFSNVPVAGNAELVRTVRRKYAADDQLLIGHFGLFGPLITTLLEPILLKILERPGLVILLMGHGSEEYREDLVRREPRLANSVWATGKLPADQLSCHLSACDIMVQPYPDGVSSRRGSFMAGLSHGKPMVTTQGELSEPLWNHTDAAIVVPVGDTEASVSGVLRLCDDAAERQRVAGAALQLYRDRFDISHSIAALRNAGPVKDCSCGS